MLEAMFRFAKRDRPSRLRASRWYLQAILACTLLLFSVSLISLVRQQDTVKELSLSNLRFGGEQVAFELEGRLQRMAADCLRVSHLDNLGYLPGDEQSLERTQLLRRRFEVLERTYPVARHFFFISAGRLVFPQFSTPPTMSLSGLISAEGYTGTAQYQALMQEGEAEDRRFGRPENALRIFLRAESLPVVKRLKAHAAFHAARAEMNAHGPAAAVPAYQRVLEIYGDQYDESRTPYALVLALDPQLPTNQIYKSYPLSRVYQDLAAGRWNLSAQQAEDLMTRLEEKLGNGAAGRPSTEFLDSLLLARVLREQFQDNSAYKPGEVASRAFRYRDLAYQLYYVHLPGERDNEAILGFSVSMAWLSDTLLPECLADTLGRSRNVTAFLGEARKHPGEQEGGDIYIPFRTTLPFWNLHIPASAVQVSEAAAHRELLFLGLSAAMFLCILGLEVYLLIRVARDEQWYQLRSDFVSGVSHELKTPLSLIRLYSETLIDSEQDYPPEERQSYIRIIARESERLSRLIDNVLDFSQIEQGRKHIHTEVGNLAETVSQTVEDYSEFLALRGFAVKVGIQPDLPPVRFNKEQISQVILNLMDNARKYSGNSRIIRVHMWMQNNQVVVEILDQGVGIPAEEIDKIFEPFYRVQRGNETGGCGLGLYLVRHAMESHGGRIEVLSEVGKGSRFRLFFPIGGQAGKSRDTSGNYQVAQARANR